MTCDSSNDSSLLDIIVLFIMSFEESMCKTTTSLLEFYGFTYFLVSLAHCCATLERSRDPFSRNRIALRFDLCLANWGTPPNPRGVFRGEPSVRNKKDCYALPLVTNGGDKNEEVINYYAACFAWFRVSSPRLHASSSRRLRIFSRKILQTSGEESANLRRL